MKKITKLTIFLTLLISIRLFAQNHNDVLVIVNDSSTISQQVGDYFKTQRSIPSVNVCHISTTTAEEIDSAKFVQIRSSIESYITSNNLTNTINYIVTTKGCPLKVKRFGSTFTTSTRSASFEGELTMCLSNISSSIANIGAVTNPYYNSATSFSRSNSFSKIFLVTRLDGYTYDDVKGLIDRAKQPYHSTGKFVFDQDPAWSSSLNTNMSTANTTLTGRGHNTLLNTTSQFVVEQQLVLGYVSWGSNDHYWSSYTQRAQPHFTWSAKALAETYVSSSGRTFTDSTYIDPAINSWQSLIADLIHENGVTGAKGYVYEPYSTSMAKVNILFDRWTNGYNLAESYYAASNYIGWMDVIVGDPKSKFAAEGHLPVELVSFSGLVKDKHVRLTWKTATETNNFGFDVEKYIGNNWKKIGFVEGNGTVNTPQEYSFTDHFLQPKNMYRLKQIDRDGKIEFSNLITVSTSRPNTFSVEQNFPNPFNPSTTIGYSISEESKIELSIYSITGQKVSEIKLPQPQEAGSHSLLWDGNSLQGTPVASGTYFYRLTATGISGKSLISEVRKMILLR